jgi:hypothetical protein
VRVLERLKWPTCNLGETTHDLPAATLRHATRFVAIAAYAVAVAIVLLSPVLSSRGSEASTDLATGSEPALYTMPPGEIYAGIASRTASRSLGSLR